MESKKINQLATEMSPAASDLTIIGDPITGVSKKITLEQISSLFAGSVSFYTNFASFPVTGVTDTIYCAKDTNKLYLWNGAYVEVFPSQALLNTYQLRSEKGSNNGYASLDSGGKVPSTQLPSYVDDIIEVANYAALPATGETGKIYITLDNNKVYRWSGSIYVEIAANNAIWGSITGTLSNQTDLQNALNTKLSSVGLTMPSGFSVANSPLTANGTLAVTGAGNATQYIDGSGALQTFPTLLSSDNLVKLVRNQSGATMTAGTVIYISGATGNKPLIAKALATGDATSAQTYGIVQANIANNADGYVVVIGNVNDIDTSALTEGQQLYLSGTTAGTFTTTKPYAPIHLVYVGIVLRSHPTQGIIGVKIQNGYEMDELHNVAAQSPNNGDILQYVTSTNLWTKTAGTTTNIEEGTRLYYTEARVDANTNVAANTAARHNAVTIGTANGLSLSTQALSLALSSTSATGALSSTDWNTFNGKQAALSGTGFVKISGTTISYDNSTYYLASNPSAYITLTSLSAGTGISYNNTTGVITSTITQYTDALARASISLTTAGTSGSSVYNSTTGVLNVPSYTLAGLGGLASGFVATGTLFARTAMTTYRDHSVSAANDAPLKSLSNTEDNWIYCDSANAQWGIYHRNIDTDLVVAGQPTLPANSIAFIGNNLIASYVDLSNGNGFFRGTISASNFSGSSSGTNTGDQDLSGYLTTATAASTYLPLAGGTLTGRLSINVTNNYGVLMNRPAITNYIGLMYQTAETNQWFVGLRELSTNHYYIYNEVLGLDAFIIDRTNNNIGIGSTPTNKLTIRNNGNSAIALRINDTNANASFLSFNASNSDAAIIAGGTAAIPFDIYTGGTARMRISATGLTTFTRNESSYGMIRLVGSANEASIGYGFPSDTDVTTWVVGKGAGLGDTTFGWYYGAVKMLLTTGGSLLINTPSGVSGGGALQVNGDVNINGNFKINGTIIGGGGGSGVTGSGTNGYITKWTSASTLGNSVLYESGSNVAIGTTSTAEKLVVNGNIISYAVSAAWAEGLSVIVPTVSTWGGMRLRRERAGYDGNWGMGYVGFDSTDDLVFISNNAGSQINNILRLTKIGNVLVNTGTDNGSKFQVSGTATFSSTVTAAGGFFDTSDSRLKIVINDYNETKGIEKVSARMYLKNSRKELGYFAQDLQEILPSAVIEGTDGFLTLSYSQVHTAKIAYLEKEVAELKELIKTLL